MRIRSGIASASVAALALGCLGVASGSSTTLASGSLLWAKRYNPPANGNDNAAAIAVSPDGTKVFVIGSSWGGATTGYDYVTLAYKAATGTPLWGKRYNGPANGFDHGYALAVSPDGTKLFVTGESYGGVTSGYDYETVAYNAATGAQLWKRRYNPPANGNDNAAAIAVSPDGTKVFVTGGSQRLTSGGWLTGGYATIAYNAATGGQLWAKRYNDGLSATALAVSPDGTKVFVTGGRLPAYATVTYNAATGAQLWVARYDWLYESKPVALAVSSDGTKLFVTGWSYASDPDYGGSTDYLTVAYRAATGAQLWAKRYGGWENSYDYAFSLAVSPDGTKVFVTGDAPYECATVAYGAATGTRLWVVNPGATRCTAVAVNPAGTKVFVTGFGAGSGDSADAATLAYDPATGAQLWVSLFNGPANLGDWFRSLAVSPDGTKVFVTGDSQGATTSNDVLTAAYQS